MGICFSSYGNQSYSRYTLWLSLYNDTAERQKVVDEATFYFAKLNDDGSYVMTDIKIDGFNMTDLSYYFNDIVAPSDKYILVSSNGEKLGYKKSNGAIELIELSVDGGQKTISNVLIYEVPDYASIIYANNTNLVINVPKDERDDYIARYGYEVKVYSGMTADNGWAHQWTEDTVYGVRVKSVEFASATKPTTLNSAFKNLQICTKIDLTNLDTTACTNFFGTFSECRELVDMDITKLIVTDLCTVISGIFTNCPKYVINSDLLHWDTSNVTNFGAAFGNIGNTTFTPKLDTSSGENFNSMFGYNPRIEVIDCSTFDTSSATDFAFMFTRCENLRTIYAKPTFVQPTGVTGQNMFSFDENLVGGMGTVWNSGHVGLDRAYIDDLPSQPGYFTDKDAVTYMTTLYTDGTFIINEKSTDRDANIVAHGAVVKEYAPLSATNNYVFTGASQVPWYSEATQIKHIKFGNAIQPTSTAYWFNGTSNSEDFDFTNLDTSKVTDMSYMFSGTGSQVAPDLSTFNTSRVTDMSGMFSSTMFNSIDCSSFDTHNVTDMDYMFEGSRASTINVSSFDTSNVTLMEGMFKNAVEVRTLNLAHFDTSNVTNMKEMFCGAQHMDTLNVSTWDTSNVTDMRAMFERAGQINGSGKTLDVSNLDVSNITDMTNMFADSGYSTINVTGWDTSNVTNMNSMFSGNWNVTELDLTSFDTSKVTNMNSMFNGCESLVTIKAEDTFNTGLVTSSNNMFFGCTSIRGGAGTTYSAVHIDKTYARKDNPPTAPGYFTGVGGGTVGKTTLYTDGTFIINEYQEDRAANIALHGAVTNEYVPLDENNPYIFSSDTVRPWHNQRGSITSVEFGSPVSPTNMAYWFFGFAITSMNWTNLDSSNVTSMKQMFYGCTNITDPYILSNLDTQNVTDMTQMFRTSGVVMIDLSLLNTQKVTDASLMFANTNISKVIGLNMPKATCSSMFANNTNTSIDVSNCIFGKTLTRLFSSCSLLTNINLTNVDTSNATSMSMMFSSCSSLTSLDLSSFNTSKVTSVANMFDACSSLTSLDLSNFDFSRVTNATYTFKGCTSLASLNIGESVSGYNNRLSTTSVFENCTNLQTIQINGNTVFKISHSSAFNNLKTDCNFYVPANLVNDYKSATNWSARASYISAI